MKPKRTQRQSGAQWQGKALNTGDKTTLNPANQKSHLSFSARVKPFAGKVFYLDLPSNRIAETLERDIKALGGTVEKFFSKEIRYLVSNKREARYVHCLRHDSPVPSPDSGPSSPHPRSVQHHPSSRGENIKSKNQGHIEPFVTSRGKSLVERVVKEQERVQISKILSNALEWGVKILYVDDVVAYVDKKKKTTDSKVSTTAPIKIHVKAGAASKQCLQKGKAGKIKKPFIKVEDSSRHYRPVYLPMQSVPQFSLKTVAPFSPFSREDKDPPGNKPRGHGSVKPSAHELKAQVRKKSKDKKRSGYCECCLVKFDNLTVHLQGGCHKAFSKSKAYSVVDRLISTLSCDFIPINTKTKRLKCSASAVVMAPGPWKEAETVPQATPRGADECPQLKTLPSDLTPLSQRHKDWRNHYTYSHSSKQKYLALKWPCRQNSVTSCMKEAQKEEVLQSHLETAPSSGDTFSTLPSRVQHVDLLDQKAQKHRKNSISGGVSSRRICGGANGREEPRSSTDSMHNSNNETETKLSEQEEESLPVESSPVQKLKRKIRVYKHKRRKVDTTTDCVDSVLKLWECFQSSDDSDLEFRGFEEDDFI